MSNKEQPPSEWARKRAAGTARRARLVERREAYFDLLMSGYSVLQIAKAMNMSASAVRRAIGQALAARRLDSHEDFARLQVARLNKALLCADRSLEVGDMRAIPHFLKVVAELDRYHGLARPMPLAPPAPGAVTPRLAAPPLALTHAPAPPVPAEASARVKEVVRA